MYLIKLRYLGNQLLERENGKVLKKYESNFWYRVSSIVDCCSQ